jgi:hypothetical protein
VSGFWCFKHSVFIFTVKPFLPGLFDDDDGEDDNNTILTHHSPNGTASHPTRPESPATVLSEHQSHVWYNITAMLHFKQVSSHLQLYDYSSELRTH